MTTPTRLILVFILFLFTCPTIAQQKIKYGSNKGKYISIFNKKIYYEEYGQGTPLLLLSGGGPNRSIKDFEYCIPELAKHYKVIAPDTPGQGRSDQPDTLTYALLSEFMSQFIDKLHIDSAYVMGWSDGGITAILLAEKRPDKIKKIIAVGANNGTRGFVLRGGISLDSVKAPTLNEFAVYYAKSIEWYNTLTPKKDWKKLVNNLNPMWYAKEYFSSSVYTNIKIPVMIVLGDRDEITIEHGLEMYRQIKGSEFCVLPNTSHEAFTEKPDLVNKIAINFFKK